MCVRVWQALHLEMIHYLKQTINVKRIIILNNIYVGGKWSNIKCKTFQMMEICVSFAFFHSLTDFMVDEIKNYENNFQNFVGNEQLWNGCGEVFFLVKNDCMNSFCTIYFRIDWMRWLHVQIDELFESYAHFFFNVHLSTIDSVFTSFRWLTIQFFLGIGHFHE